MPTHREAILDQFTRQAVPFSTAPAIGDEGALRLMLEATGADADDTVLDVACGPGIVVCAFAPVVRHATGIDLTPAMLDRAKALAEKKGVTNVAWEVGDVTKLPYPDAAFTLVTSRFAFHHLESPGDVLKEMRRVCAPGGRVCVIDVATSPDPARAALFNRMEKLRDPSHVRALPQREHEALFAAAGFAPPRIQRYGLETTVEDLLSRSFPNEGDADRVRTIVSDSIADDAMGALARRVDGQDRFTYPIAMLVADR